VLVVSHTNSAVDQALLEIAQDLGDDLVEGSVLRLGDPRDPRLLNGDGLRLRAEPHIRERSRELLERKDVLLAGRQDKAAHLAQIRRLVAIAQWAARAPDELRVLRALVDELHDTGREAAAAREAAVAAADAHAAQLQVSERARELEQRMRDGQPLRDELGRRQALLVPAEARLHEAERLAREAEALYEQIAATGGVMRRLRGLPKLSEQEHIVGQRRAAETAAPDERDQISQRLAEVREPLLELEGQVRAFEAERGMPLDLIVLRSHETEAAAQRARKTTDAFEAHADALAGRLATRTEARLTQLRDWRLTRVHPEADLEPAIGALEAAIAAAADVLQGQNLDGLRAEQTSLIEALRAISAELQQIEDALAEVETFVIGEAMVVATTLTRAYKRESVQARRFDTLILDEASMAPIPALWVVAGLADANVVVVGDPKQLPPRLRHRTRVGCRRTSREPRAVAGAVPHESEDQRDPERTRLRRDSHRRRRCQRRLAA
jgi:hypothetical protein